MKDGTTVYITNAQTKKKLNKFVKYEDRSKSKAINRLMEIAFGTPEVIKILESNEN